MHVRRLGSTRAPGTDRLLCRAGYFNDRWSEYTGEALGLVTRSGSWYSFDSERLGQGIGNSAQALEENTALAEKLEAAIREKAALGATLPTGDAGDAEDE